MVINLGLGVVSCVVMLLERGRLDSKSTGAHTTSQQQEATRIILNIIVNS